MCSAAHITVKRRSGERARRLVLLALALAAVQCGKKDAAPQATLATGAPGTASAPTDAASPPAVDVARESWSAAASLEPEDLSRLALKEGSSGLVARATEMGDAQPVGAGPRTIAVHALAFAEDLDGLPFLAEVAGGADATLALAAADSAGALAALRRKPVEAEDALEVREGCDRLLAVAKDPARPRPLRLRIVRALRMLADRGCARDLPKIE